MQESFRNKPPEIPVKMTKRPARKMPLDPPEGLSAVVYGQIAVLIFNTTIQLFILWAAIDAYARHEFGIVTGLAVANGVLLLISLAVLWFGRTKKDKG
jgi:hypothetical protein